MGLSVDLVKLKRNEKDIEILREGSYSDELSDKLFKELAYLGGKSVATENTLKDYDNNIGVFTLKQAIDENRLSQEALNKLDNFFLNWSIDLKTVKEDLTLVINLNY